MPNTAAQIESRLRAFADEIRALTRQELMDAVNNVLGGAATAKRGPGRPRKATPAPVSRPPTAKKAPTTSGGRRASATVANTIERVLAHIVAHPGQGAEHIGPELRLTTRQLALPITKLLGSGHITRQGVRRATRYFPGPNASGKLPVPSRRGRPKKK